MTVIVILIPNTHLFLSLSRPQTSFHRSLQSSRFSIHPASSEELSAVDLKQKNIVYNANVFTNIVSNIDIEVFNNVMECFPNIAQPYKTLSQENNHSFSSCLGLGFLIYKLTAWHRVPLCKLVYLIFLKKS